MAHKQTYTTPRLTQLGSVADLTHAGNTNPTNRDFKGGSNNANPPVASNVASSN